MSKNSTAGIDDTGVSSQVMMDLITKMMARSPIQHTVKHELVHDAEVKRVVIPSGMTANGLLDYARALVESEETKQQLHHNIPGISADVLVCMWKVLEQKYEFAKYLTDRNWFGGEVPPPLVNIKTGTDTSVRVPYAKISPPRWEGGWIRPHINGANGVVITGEYKRKFQSEVDEFVKAVEDTVKTESIYRGKSIILDYQWRIDGEGFNFDKNSPTFETPPNYTLDSVIMNRDVQTRFKANIVSRLVSRQFCKQNKIPFKHGVVLGGPYGTGKTMTGALISKLATDHGITFIHLKQSSELAEALQLAKQYGPAVLFCEDIDSTAGENERTEELNEILNTLDGVDTKDMEVMCIFTTNHANKLNPAFLRAGRIDTFLFMGHPDAEASIRFLHMEARNDAGESLLAPNIDLEACGKVLAHKSPSFITTIVNEAKTHFISNNPDATTLVGTLTENDITLCAQATESHIKMTMMKETDKLDTVLSAFEVVGDILMGRANLSN